ncbi:AI-2E family transporter [Halomicroarcula sp. F13]|uniref:AI-2E family transporter n=1 Tax=Haloarcula rubra TaxID=2487747 RepID=A0AAW4PP77_9EURY|nr:AI-2E family transporter [Halomicroarcula rubra]MBX0322034.1 AI-2E family transporter [Halomicroarcula rubra]
MHDTDRPHGSPTSQSRLGWWLLVVGLAGVLAFAATHVTAMLVLGVFGYYATRPICDRIGAVVDSDRVAATVTVLVVLVPTLLVLVSLVAQTLRRLQRLLNGPGVGRLAGTLETVEALSAAQRTQLRTLVTDPLSVLGGQNGALLSNGDVLLGAIQGVFGTVMTLALAVTLSYALLSRDAGLRDAFVELVGGVETTAYAYAAAVDEDLESVFFGNFLFAVIMAVVAVATYWTTNLLAPDGLAVPMVLTLGLLTGAASLVPVVVGKLVYVPVVASLAVQALTGPGELPFVGAVALVYVLVLDLLPQALVQPYVSSRRLDMLALLFAYLVGPVVFGWYGFFLLPIVFVLALEAVRLVLPELLDGERPLPSVSLDTDSGTDPQDERDDVPDATAPQSDSDGTAVSDGGTTDGDPSTG